jgi:hypothetical protein
MVDNSTAQKWNSGLTTTGAYVGAAVGAEVTGEIQAAGLKPARKTTHNEQDKRFMFSSFQRRKLQGTYTDDSIIA